MVALRRVGFASLFCALAVWLWFALANHPRRTDWLEVEAPDSVSVGQSFSLRVRVHDPSPGGFLDADLHWSTHRHESRGYLTRSVTQAFRTGVSNYVFTLVVPNRVDLGFVHAIIFSSRSGHWSDRTQVGISEPIPVRHLEAGSITGTAEPPMYRLRLHELERTNIPSTRESIGIRITTASLLLGAGIAMGLNTRTRRILPAVLVPSAIKTKMIVVALMLGAGWEALDLSSRLAERMRASAESRGVYEQREGFQRALTVSVILLAFGWAVRFGRRPLPLAWRFAGFAGITWGTVALTTAISLHSVDRIGGLALGGVSVAQWLRLGAAVLVFAGFPAATRSNLSARKNSNGCPGTEN